jgi:hypothetical protein
VLWVPLDYSPVNFDSMTRISEEYQRECEKEDPGLKKMIKIGSMPRNNVNHAGG